MAISLKNTTNIKTIIRWTDGDTVTETVIDGSSEYTELTNDVGNAVLALNASGYSQEGV